MSPLTLPSDHPKILTYGVNVLFVDSQKAAGDTKTITVTETKITLNAQILLCYTMRNVSRSSRDEGAGGRRRAALRRPPTSFSVSTGRAVDRRRRRVVVWPPATQSSRPPGSSSGDFGRPARTALMMTDDDLVHTGSRNMADSAHALTR